MELGPVVLRSADSAEVAEFYSGALGFEAAEADGGHEVSSGGDDLLSVLDEPDAPPRPPDAAGLYHVAFIVPSRRALADAVARLLDSGAGLTGAADHLVSEAVYLEDADGNGVEVYADRPREEWRESTEGVEMDTLPLDVAGLLEHADPERGVDAAVGHVHLEVTDLGASEDFYRDLGLDLRASWSGARFLAADGYHHHVGLNTWGRRTRGLPSDAEGLVGFGVEGVAAAQDPDGAWVADDIHTVY